MTELTPPVQSTEEKPPANSRHLPVWVVVLAFAILLAFLLLLGLGLRRVQAGPITVGSEVPAFKLQTFDGETLNTADMKGKVIVVNFWASWCGPCESEAADLQRAWEMYEPTGEVIFLGLAYTDTEPKSLAYINKFGITYINAPDLGTRVSQMFRITGVPETYFIDKEGKLAYKKLGPFTSLIQIQTVIDGLLN